MTPLEWLRVRVDVPPKIGVARDPVVGAWHVMLRIDGGYGAQQDAEVAAERLCRELLELLTRPRGC